MNRQERRRLGIKKKDPMVSLKQSDIDRMKEEATEKGCKLAFNLMLALPSMVIHDKYGLLMKKKEEWVDSLTSAWNSTSAMRKATSPCRNWLSASRTRPV